MVDCMVAYESDFRPQMKLIDAKAPLPCSDVVWESSDLDKDLIFDSKNGMFNCNIYRLCLF